MSYRIIAWRLVYNDESSNSHKFYDAYFFPDEEIAVYRWGRVGSKGQSVTKTAVAKWVVRRALEAKLDKGYILQVSDLEWFSSHFPSIASLRELIGMEADQEIGRHLRKAASESFGDARLHEFTEQASELVKLSQSKKTDVGAMMDRWQEVSTQWDAMAVAFEHARLAMLEAEQAVARRVMG